MISYHVYGLLMARSTYEGMKLANERKRPFVLTRAGFLGSQHYAATWTGDNLSTWEHLHMSLPMALQLGLSGQPFSGPDIGGFAGNATPKLWMGLGALFPFCNGHSEAETIDHEPWSFGTKCEEVCRLALLRCYLLLPHIYTLFYLAHTKGTPIAAPSFFADPQNTSLRTGETSFLLGSILVCLSTTNDQGSHELSQVLPGGKWLHFDFEDSHPDLPTLYIQGGSIVPVGLPLQYVGEANMTDDLTLFIALDNGGKAEGVLYEDDGDGYEFTKGAYLLTCYTAELHSSVITIRVSKTEGSWKRPKRALHVHVLLGGGAMVNGVGVDREEIQVTMPSDSEVADLVTATENQYRMNMENAKQIPDANQIPGDRGIGLSKNPVDLKNGDCALKVVPWIGGRIISMTHVPSDAVGRDLIPSMVYGREVGDQDYGGMYCAILTVNSSVVSVGILRVLGSVAELILVATNKDR